MNLLAFETSSPSFSICLQYGDTFWPQQELLPQQHAKVILSATELLLQQAGFKLNQLDGIVYSCGPGSFTGIRIGAAVAQAMAFVQQRPLLAIPSLQSIAQGICRQLHHPKVMLVLDARMGQAYCGYYELAADRLMHAVRQDILVSIEEIEFSSISHDWVIITDLPQDIRARFPNSISTITDFVPNAVDLLPFAQKLLAEGTVGPLEEALPVYLRTEESWRNSNSR